VETLAREAEWKWRDTHNDTEAARWAVEAPDGWGNTPPTSPIQEGWPGVPADTNQKTWPLLSDAVLLRPDGWPDLLPLVQDRVRVTIKVVSSVRGIEEHSAYRSLVVIGHLSVHDLLSFPCHSAVGTSFRSCCGGID
jgi:hypothetical protein